MLQIIYASAATKPYNHHDLMNLLRVAREKNSAAGISGMLLYHDGSFLQVLEGPDTKVHELYRKIEKDPHHTNFLLLLREAVQEREFENWSMGFLDTSQIGERPEGFIDYVRDLKSMTLDKTRARKILKTFQEGSWRRSANDQT
jgi:hypothetical protein